MDLRKLFRRETMPTASEMTAAVESLEAEQVAALKRRDDLAEERKGVLLVGTKEQAAAHEAKLADAALDLERIEIRIAALRERIAETERQDGEAAERKILDDAEAAGAEAAGLAEQYLEHAQALVQVLDRMETLDQQVYHANRLILGTSGKKLRFVADAKMIRTSAERLAEKQTPGGMAPEPIWMNTTLPDPRERDDRNTLWPQVQTA